MDRQKAR
jgi:hypothetical protein